MPPPEIHAGATMQRKTSALQRNRAADRHDDEDTAHDQPSPEVSAPDIEVAPPDVPAPSGRVRAAAASARRPAAASGRGARSGRAAAASGRPAAASARQPKRSGKAPADPGARAASQKTVIKIALGVLVALVLATAVIILTTRTSDDRRKGAEALAAADEQAKLVDSALVRKRGDLAQAAYDAALKALTATPQLGGAVAAPPETSPVVKDLALRAHALRQEVERRLPRLEEVKNENAATANLTALRARLGALGNAATDIDALEKDVLAFCDNPVDPSAGPSAAHAATFATLVAELRLRLKAIADEHDRRKSLATVTPVREAEAEIQGLITAERFGEALARLDALATQHKLADFTPLRTRVNDGASRAWAGAKLLVETRTADWKAPGSTESQRAAALAAIKERLDQVIERFGIETYVGEARSMRSALP